MSNNNKDTMREIIKQVEALKAKKKFREALQLLQKTLIDNANDYRLYEEMCDIYIYLSDYKKASNAVDFAINLNPESATGNYLKGFILLSTDKIKEAVKYLEASNKAFGNNAEVLRNLGWAYTMIGDPQRGIMVLRRALNISPHDNLIIEDLAMALISSGSIVEGNKLLKKINKENSLK